MTNVETAVAAAQAEVERRRELLVEFTRDLVRIPSVNPKFRADPALNREADVQALLDPLLREDGFATERYEVFPGRPNLIAERAGSERRSLILCGHVDVVPAGGRGRWSVDLFGGEVKDGRLYGRGAVDMKGGLAACVAAARAIRAAGLTLEGRLAVHAVVDEEAGGFGAMEAVRRGRLAKARWASSPPSRASPRCATRPITPEPASMA